MNEIEKSSGIRRPKIGITIGNAAGIGPEVVLRSLTELPPDYCEPVVIGDMKHLESLQNEMGLGLNLVSRNGNSNHSEPAILVEDLANLPSELPMGGENAAAGKASGEYIVRAVEMWRSGEIDAISTAPISKRSLSLGGYDHPGHTEFLADLTQTERFAMSFFAGQLRVILLSTHMPLRKAIEFVTAERLISLIEFSAHTLGSLLGKRVKLAVAGLNPHASEDGMFGSEEHEYIVPAVEQSKNAGIDVHGPFSPDTIFLRAFRGEFDGVIALYHDQATIPVKALSFGSAVNVTLGLPLIRTSVDHGTAFDIAGRLPADHSSMLGAIKLAADLFSLKSASDGGVS